MVMRIIVLLLFSLFFFSIELDAQKVERIPNIMETVVIDGDTIPLYRFDPVYIFATPTFKNKREERRYGKLRRYVVKVYPYAEIAGEMLQEFDDTLKMIKLEYKRKKYIKEVEGRLMNEFEGELKKLTIKQGIILVKLIDRETGNTSYELVKELKGSFSAFIWQSLARLFGSNLKLNYDPYGEDSDIEDIVLRIENGQIPYQKRERKI